jgi:hypothetical protein
MLSDQSFSDRTFRLRPAIERGIVTGRVQNTQRLILRVNEGYLMIVFDESGVLQDSRIIFSESDATGEGLRRHLEIIDCSISPILIRPFRLNLYPIELNPLASWMIEFLADPNAFCGTSTEILDMEEEKRYLFDDVNRWIEQGYYAFHFNNEYWIDTDGNIETT